MNEGKKFEQDWKKSVPKNVYYLRLKDNAASFGQDSKLTRFTSTNPYDCIMFRDGILFPMELKSTESRSITIQRDEKEESKMIKLHQIIGLNDASKTNGVIAGFVFDFRGSNTYWLNIKHFMTFLKESDKKSINENDVVKYNGIIIDKNKLRTRYIYDIDKLLKGIARGDE